MVAIMTTAVTVKVVCVCFGLQRGLLAAESDWLVGLGDDSLVVGADAVVVMEIGGGVAGCGQGFNVNWDIRGKLVVVRFHIVMV